MYGIDDTGISQIKTYHGFHTKAKKKKSTTIVAFCVEIIYRPSLNVFGNVKKPKKYNHENCNKHTLNLGLCHNFFFSVCFL